MSGSPVEKKWNDFEGKLVALGTCALNVVHIIVTLRGTNLACDSRLNSDDDPLFFLCLSAWINRGEVKIVGVKVVLFSVI